MSFYPSFLPIHPTNHAIILQSVAVSSSRTFRRSHEMMSSAAGRVIHRGVRSFHLGVWSWLIDYRWRYQKRSGFLEMISRVRNRQCHASGKSFLPVDLIDLDSSADHVSMHLPFDHLIGVWLFRDDQAILRLSPLVAKIHKAGIAYTAM